MSEVEQREWIQKLEAQHNRRQVNTLEKRSDALKGRLRALQGHLRREWNPEVRYGLSLARTVYGVDQTRRAMCESRLSPFARNASGATGLLQFLPLTWRSTPFGGYSMWDPVAQALAGGWMVRAGRSGEWTCGL